MAAGFPEAPLWGFLEEGPHPGTRGSKNHPGLGLGSPGAVALLQYKQVGSLRGLQGDKREIELEA